MNEPREQNAASGAAAPDRAVDGALFQALFEAAPDALFLVDEQGLILRANQQAHAMFRRPSGAFAGEHIEALVPEPLRRQHSHHRHKFAARPAARGMGVGLDLRAVRADGSEFFVDIGLSPMMWQGRRLVVAAVRDVTEQRHVEHMLRDALRDQALRDPLTGLFNRRMLDESLHLEFARARRRHATVAVVMADIDHFKLVNDRHGHQCGDYVLQRLAGLLQGQMRSGDLVCRYGGEEFILILVACSEAAACERAEQIRAVLHQTQWATIDCAVPQITLSFGVAVHPQHGSMPEDVIRAADAALLKAKAAGRDRVVAAPQDASSGSAGACA